MNKFMTKDEARETLNVDGEPDERSLKKAWQRALFGAHPDHGGSTDDVERVQIAYRIMKGEPQSGAPSHSMDVFMQAFQQALTSINSLNDLKTVDLVAAIKRKLADRKLACVQKLGQLDGELMMYKEALSRFTCKRTSDPVKRFLEQNIASANSMQTNLKAEANDVEEAMAIADDYQYEHTVQQSYTTQYSVNLHW